MIRIINWHYRQAKLDVKGNGVPSRVFSKSAQHRAIIYTSMGDRRRLFWRRILRIKVLRVIPQIKVRHK